MLAVLDTDLRHGVDMLVAHNLAVDVHILASEVAVPEVASP
jgi:hypothetical protein